MGGAGAAGKNTTVTSARYSVPQSPSSHTSFCFWLEPSYLLGIPDTALPVTAVGPLEGCFCKKHLSSGEPVAA